jgi:predicted short-subunit dehydrogenase-like oxidoreductase (DUF2520 family)
MISSSAERIVMIGSGNVATHFAMALHASGHRIDMVYSRTTGNARKLAEKVNARWTSDIHEIDRDTGICIFSLTDQATLDTVNSIGYRGGFLIHTAGSLPMNIFSGHSDDYGVMYPLQTFPCSNYPGFPEIPVCIESNTSTGLDRLRRLASVISSEVHEMSSEKRILIHAGAVFASNFTNHMYSLASRVSAKAGFPFAMYHSLIMETARKATQMDPPDAQTGPAQRNDLIIINKHLDLLSFSPELRSIYLKLTESILKNT